MWGGTSKNEKENENEETLKLDMEMYWKIENVNQCPVGDMKRARG